MSLFRDSAIVRQECHNIVRTSLTSEVSKRVLDTLPVRPIESLTALRPPRRSSAWAAGRYDNRYADP